MTLARLGVTPARLNAAYRRGALTDDGPTSDSLDADDRAALRSDGRHLVDALLRYLDADGSRAADAESEAAGIATRLGERLASAGVRTADAVPRFVAARGPILDEISRIARRRRLDADRTSEIFVAASSVLDRLLLVFIAAHERATGPSTRAAAEET